MKLLALTDIMSLSVKTSFSGFGILPLDTKLTAPPAWVSSDELIATVEASDDGFDVDITPLAEGTCKITVTATAAGIDYFGEYEIEVVPAFERNLEISLIAINPA